MEPPLELARRLEARDESLAAAAAELQSLERESEWLRTRAAELVALEERAPEERAELERRASEARRELEERRAAERSAEAALERAAETGDRARVVEAQRAVVRARDVATTSARKLAHVEGLAAELVRTLADAERERLELEAEAARTAARLDRAPRLVAPPAPAGGLEAIVDWGARARAALLLARSAAEGERELVVREANELGASVLGQPAYGASVEQIRRRLEEPG